MPGPTIEDITRTLTTDGSMRAGWGAVFMAVVLSLVVFVVAIASTEKGRSRSVPLIVASVVSAALVWGTYAISSAYLERERTFAPDGDLVAERLSEHYGYTIRDLSNDSWIPFLGDTIAREPGQKSKVRVIVGEKKMRCDLRAEETHYSIWCPGDGDDVLLSPARDLP